MQCILAAANFMYHSTFGSYSSKTTEPPQIKKISRHFLHCESFWFFSYFFFLLSLFILSLGPEFHLLTPLHSLNYFHFCFHCYHLGLLSSTLYHCLAATSLLLLCLLPEFCTLKMLHSIVKSTKSWTLVEDAHTWHCKPDTWTNLRDRACGCTFASLKVCNLKVHM